MPRTLKVPPKGRYQLVGRLSGLPIIPIYENPLPHSITVDNAVAVGGSVYDKPGETVHYASRPCGLTAAMRGAEMHRQIEAMLGDNVKIVRPDKMASGPWKTINFDIESVTWSEEMRRYIERLSRNSTYGKYAWAGAPANLGQVWTTPPKKESPMTTAGVTPFEAPSRPAEPAPPADTPSAAALRPLLLDRQRIKGDTEAEIDTVREHIENLKAELATSEADLQHEIATLAKVDAEILSIEGDIALLNGERSAST